MATVVQRLIGRDGHRCVWCGCGLKAAGESSGGVYATADHVIPKAKKGTNVLSNLVLACNRCNQRRGTKAFAVFFDECAEAGMNVQRGIVDAALTRIGSDRWAHQQRIPKAKRKPRSILPRRQSTVPGGCPHCGGMLILPRRSGVSRQCMFCHAIL